MTNSLDLQAFIAPRWLQNPHIQTILPRIIKQPSPNYSRELHPDSTGKTQVAYDFIWSDKSAHDKPLAVMFHGLEGSSQSSYAKAFAHWAYQQGYDAVVVHYRGCGGLINHATLDYNAGDIVEIHYVLGQLLKRRTHLLAVGVSLGGNMLAKYMGVYQDNARCLGAVVISAPVDLATSARVMHRLVARHVYTPYLLNSLIKKAKLKLSYDEAQKLQQLKTLDAFDDFYTAPRHGYRCARDYYRQASALPVLGDITKPTLIIGADDDPFLGLVARPSDVSSKVRLLYSRYGGHVGFVGLQSGKPTLTWLPKTTFTFFDWVLSGHSS